MLKKLLHISVITCKRILYIFKKSNYSLQKIPKNPLLQYSHIVNIF